MANPDSQAASTLSQGARELELPDDFCSGESHEKLCQLVELLSAWNQQMSLTAHRSPEAIARNLVLDGLALGQALPELLNLADIGTGPGFPGLPIAILRPELELTLIESRERPHHFQRGVARELGLGNVTPLRGRAEEMPASAHSAAIAQAAAKPELALSWLERWVGPGGLLLLPYSMADLEVSELPGVRFERWIEYQVPLGGPQRRLWVGKHC